jgi:hypothetical protein
MFIFFKQTYKNKWSFTCVCRFYFVGLLYNKTIKMKKIDLVKLVEEVDKEEMIEGGVHKIFALTCLHKFIEMQEEAINYTHSCKSDSEKLEAVEDLKEWAMTTAIVLLKKD